MTASHAHGCLVAIGLNIQSTVEQFETQHCLVKFDRLVELGRLQLQVADPGEPLSRCGCALAIDARHIDGEIVTRGIGKKQRRGGERMGVFLRPFERDLPIRQHIHHLFDAMLGGGKRIGRCAARGDRLAALFFLQINTDAFAGDIHESMRPKALRFDVKTVAFGDPAAEHLHVKILSDHDIVNRHDEMIQSLHQHDFLRCRTDFDDRL